MQISIDFQYHYQFSNTNFLWTNSVTDRRTLAEVCIKIRRSEEELILLRKDAASFVTYQTSKLDELSQKCLVLETASDVCIYDLISTPRLLLFEIFWVFKGKVPYFAQNSLVFTYIYPILGFSEVQFPTPGN